jgi:hypothetical protein
LLMWMRFGTSANAFEEFGSCEHVIEILRRTVAGRLCVRGYNHVIMNVEDTVHKQTDFSLYMILFKLDSSGRVHFSFNHIS